VDRRRDRLTSGETIPDEARLMRRLAELLPALCGHDDKLPAVG
jgi:hypothetical protein